MEKQKSTRAREIAEQRRSGAAGKHGKYRKDRRNERRKAVERSKAEA